jgi:glyoxylase-like metal-dependent hydrolase (beta-lactamase superfamily II)
MTEIGTRDTTLNWDVIVAPGIPIVTDDLPPGAKQRMFSPVSATLISGKRDAVLVDALLTVDQALALVDRVAASGKNLTTIYATHGHGDHFFGVSTVLERFPNARFVATPDVIKVMRQQTSSRTFESFWNARFPGQISDGLVIAEELIGNVIDLEGHHLVALPLGHTDTDNTPCLHAPSIGLVVAGDAAYNGVHLYLAESNPQTRREWIAALDTIEALNPTAVIAGHKWAENDDSPKIIEETGFVVLVHDHRNFGVSDGAERGDIDPWQQIADWRRAISFLENQPEVDAAHIGIWGTSYAGGHAIVLGATDRRLRAVVAQVPTISGFEQGLRRVVPEGVAGLESTFAEDDRGQLRGEPLRRQLIVSDDATVPASYRSKDAIDFYLQPIPPGIWENSVTIRSTRAARMYEPGIWVEYSSHCLVLRTSGPIN